MNIQSHKDKLPPNLTGVPETMLWTLHNRASEAKRPDRILSDPHAVQIYDSLEYDFTKTFGRPDGSHAVRSKLFDQELLKWMGRHPEGAIVNLGEGLETQVLRIDNGKAKWYSVDVESAIAIRERFIPSEERHIHIPKSALDCSWMDEIDDSKGVFITAQGLFMYFQEEDVQKLFVAIAQRFPKAVLMFDVIPTWFSTKTMKGYQLTPHYVAPPMPWGIRRDHIRPLLQSWFSEIASIHFIPYGPSRTKIGWLMPILSATPWVRNFTPTIVYVEFNSNNPA